MTTTIKRRPQLRIALNSRCNRACFYCRPSGEASSTAAGLAIDPDDLLFFISVAARRGLIDVKLTGGDPALYDPLVDVARAIRSDTSVNALEVISRHPLIGGKAAALAAAGVTTFNMSIDTIDPELHKRICGVDDLPELLAALDVLVSTTVPVKVNTVVMKGVNADEVMRLVTFCETVGVASLKLLDVIEDLDGGTEFNTVRLRRKGQVLRLEELYLPLEQISQTLRETASSVAIQTQGDLGHPMSVFTMPSGLKVIVKDSQQGSWYGPICAGCPHFPCHDSLMAVRLTADLRAQFCLLRDEITVDLSDAIRSRDQATLDDALGEVLDVYAEAEFVPSGRPLLHAGGRR